MKNIHVLPTEKPSRLFIDVDDNKLKICVPLGGEHMMNQHIYITSDEEIKKVDWCICEYSDGGVSVNTYKDSSGINKYKIVLTTDQDLIKDGVQAIDNEFLEWFVKNPSCENIEVCKNPFYEESNYEHYKIIIPQEEPKQEILEEAAEKSAIEQMEAGNSAYILGFIEGAKWQAERMYSKEELHNAFYNGWLYRGENYSFPEAKKEWVELFKK